MNNLQKKSDSRLGYLSLGIVFAVMFVLNMLMPIHRDDYDYSMVWGTGRHLSSLGDVFYSMWQHYLLHGGRMVTVFVLDMGLYLGKLPFDLLNAGAFTALVLLLYFHARRELRTEGDGQILLAAGILSWLSYPHFGEVAIWKSGSTVYLWSALCAAAFLLPYNLYVKKLTAALDSAEEKAVYPAKGGALRAVMMFLLGILGGWSVENLAVTTVLLAGGCIFYVRLLTREKTGGRSFVPAWFYTGAAGALIGFAGILAAPGNYVRYDEQGEGKGILDHLGNQLAGNSEMLLYVLPMVLILLCIWRLLKQEIAMEKGVIVMTPQQSRHWGRWLTLGFLALLIVSYFTSGFAAIGIRDFLVAHVLVPLHQTRPKTLELFANLMAGFEEMMIYWLIIFLAYSVLKEKLGISKTSLAALQGKISWRDVLAVYPEVRYVGGLLALALFNNFVMVAAPTFPARATFSSVSMLIVATLAALRMPVVRQKLLQGAAGRVVAVSAGAVSAFTIAASLVIMWTMYQENAVRLEAVQKAAAEGVQVVEFEPIEITNRALRHIYFEDFYNNVTKEGLCEYYGIKDIKVRGWD